RRRQLLELDLIRLRRWGGAQLLEPEVLEALGGGRRRDVERSQELLVAAARVGRGGGDGNGRRRGRRRIRGDGGRGRRSRCRIRGRGRRRGGGRGPGSGGLGRATRGGGGPAVPRGQRAEHGGRNPLEGLLDALALDRDRLVEGQAVRVQLLVQDLHG